MNQHKQSSDLSLGRGWLNRAAEMLDGCEDHRSDAEFAHAAAIIGNGFIALAHAERAAASMAETSQVRQAFLELPDWLGEALRHPLGHPVPNAEQPRAAAEARPHDDEHALNPHTDKDCSGGAFLRLECDLQLDGASVLSLHKVGSDVHLRVWHAGSDEYAVAVLGRAYRRDVVHALAEFDTSEADRG